MVLVAVLVAAFLIVRPADAGLASQHVEYTEVQSEDVQVRCLAAHFMTWSKMRKWQDSAVSAVFLHADDASPYPKSCKPSTACTSTTQETAPVHRSTLCAWRTALRPVPVLCQGHCVHFPDLAAILHSQLSNRRPHPDTRGMISGCRMRLYAARAHRFLTRGIHSTHPTPVTISPVCARLMHVQEAGHLSVLFDVGGIAGGILAGHLSDKTGASALVTAVLLSLSIPSLWVYRKVGDMSLVINMLLMALVGALTGGPQGLIATAVSADLGNHDSLQVGALELGAEVTCNAVLHVNLSFAPCTAGQHEDSGHGDRNH